MPQKKNLQELMRTVVNNEKLWRIESYLYDQFESAAKAEDEKLARWYLDAYWWYSSHRVKSTEGIYKDGEK